MLRSRIFVPRFSFFGFEVDTPATLIDPSVQGTIGPRHCTCFPTEDVLYSDVG